MSTSSRTAYTIMCDEHHELRHDVRRGWRVKVALWWFGLFHRRCGTDGFHPVYAQLESRREEWMSE